MKMGQEGMRKGPWTEQEDLKLVSFVSLFGDRRWDFIAKVSGLHRTGKSCRLRWVNYLHPDLRRGKMTPQEEILVLELHSKWGNRWSKIARKLPGRTDNEIKNYWRTYMRKEAQKKKRASSLKSASSNCYSSSSSDQIVESFPSSEAGVERFYDTGGVTAKSSDDKRKDKDRGGGGDQSGSSMDDIWKNISVSEVDFLQPVYNGHSEEGCNFFCPPINSPSWEYSAESLWMMDIEESKMFLPTPNDQFLSCYEFGDYLLTV